MRYCAVVSTRHGSSCFDPSHFQVSFGGALACWRMARGNAVEYARETRLGWDLLALPGIWWTIGFRNVIAMFHELGGDLIVGGQPRLGHCRRVCRAWAS